MAAILPRIPTVTIVTAGDEAVIHGQIQHLSSLTTLTENMNSENCQLSS